ncbi:MAG: class I SAM-dependent methyltransferase [Trueperaceae bacterium]
MNKLYPEFFRRVDETPDEFFYQTPQLEVSHIDKAADKAAHDLYNKLLPDHSDIMDFMAGWQSHLPNKFRSVVGLGLNHVELQNNPLITESIVYDINTSERLPFKDNQFDGVVCTASVQYMTRPDDTFPEIARALKPGAPFIVTFSNRMFPSKAVLAWRSSDDAAHTRLVRSYFSQVPAFTDVSTFSFVPANGDPLYAVWAYKRKELLTLN